MPSDGAQLDGDIPLSSPSAAGTEMNAAPSQAGRETIESIVIAVILAFLFRGFVAEAFVIPTGSMAPTLQGRHLDLVCEECGFQYRNGASQESEFVQVDSGRCPLCRHVMDGLPRDGQNNQASFDGDRILVSKFAYQFAEPKRWDVIVFKYPGDAKINYIKRLVGLPGEHLRIRHGNIEVLRSTPAANLGGEASKRYRIVRKPPDKVLAMLQLVDDSRYLSPRLAAAEWPGGWSSPAAPAWQGIQPGTFTVANSQDTAWLRYRHLPATAAVWQQVRNGQAPELPPPPWGRLITDGYAYNYSNGESLADGENWVGDLAVECHLEVRSASGKVHLDLVEGGTHFECQIDVATGNATLTLAGAAARFCTEEGETVAAPVGATPLVGPGTYRLRFANVDDELHLWVNDRHIPFDHPATYQAAGPVVPCWSPSDPGDALPAGLGATGLDATAHSLRIFRDVYYRAVSFESAQGSEYDRQPTRSRARLDEGEEIEQVFSRPDLWAGTDLFLSRRTVIFSLAEDQFFPLGDNSPQSKDARLWSSPANGFGLAVDPPPYVQRDLLIGRAIAIYWPHGWRLPFAEIGVVPNFQRIGLIH